MNKYLLDQKEEFTKVMDFFKKDISSLRTGRANPSLLDGVFVEAYGTRTPLIGVANVSVSDARSMIVSPWDKSLMKAVEKAITEANLGLSITGESDKIRVSVPLMTEEIRKEMVKRLNEKMETARISLRQLRDDVRTIIEKAEEDKEIAEDDKFRFLKELDDESKKLNDEIKALRDAKENEVMSI